MEPKAGQVSPARYPSSALDHVADDHLPSGNEQSADVQKVATLLLSGLFVTSFPDSRKLLEQHRRGASPAWKC